MKHIHKFIFIISLLLVSCYDNTARDNPTNNYTFKQVGEIDGCKAYIFNFHKYNEANQDRYLIVCKSINGIAVTSDTIL